MIRLGLRLAFAGGRSAVVSALLTGLALAIGAAVLLVALAVPTAYAARQERSVLNDGSYDHPPAAGAYTAARESGDAFADRPITVLDVAAVGDDPPRPPELPALAPGELLISPALAELAGREPLLAQRYPPGTPLLSESLVPSPASLIVVRGAQAPPDVRSDLSWQEIPPAAPPTSLVNGVGLLVLVGAVGVLAPVFVLVGAATRLTAAGRERRMAALRLAGASTAQTVRLVAVETLLVGITGAVAGWAAFLLFGRSAGVHLTAGDPWYVEDLVPSGWAYAVALVGVPLVAVVGAQLALRRVAVSPLGVGRGAGPRPLRVWRLLPVPVAVVVLATSVTGPLLEGPLVLVGIALVLTSLLLAGPWLVQVQGALLARSGRPAVLLAGRRLTTDPRAGFRAVSGGVLAAFGLSLFLSTYPTIPPAPAGPATTSDVALGQAADDEQARAAAQVLAGIPDLAVSVLHRGPLAGLLGAAWVGDCPELAGLAGIDPGRCAPGRVLVAPEAAGLTQLPPAISDPTGNGPVPLRGERVVALLPDRTGAPSMIVPTDALDPAVPLSDVLVSAVALRGPAEAVERGRTALFAAGIPVDLQTVALQQRPLMEIGIGYSRLLAIALVITYCIAGLSAAVTATGGLMDRRRSFALLRMAGAPLGVLRRSTALEVVVPLVTISAAAALLGVLTGRLTLAGIGGEAALDQRPVPWAGLALPVVGGVVVALLLGCAALPLVRRLTDGETTRFA